MKKINVGILGCTGIVGQRLISLLSDHPWFQITALAASEKSCGKMFREACKWRLTESVPEKIRNMVIQPGKPILNCEVLFSAVSGKAAHFIEYEFAKNGYAVVSNTSAYRMKPDVPLLIPEVNESHTGLIDVQMKINRGTGFIVTNPNCSTIPLSIVLAPLENKWGIDKVNVTTLQAVSGAGIPGVSSFDLVDNVIPYIENEEEKIETETQKILGSLVQEEIQPSAMKISASVFRVPVLDGHTLAVSVKLKDKASIQDIKDELSNFSGTPQKLKLPTAPEKPIVVMEEPDRPQPRLDRNTGNGMSVVVGRIRECPVFDVKMTILGHNTIRGAAGAAILNAELLKEKGYI